MAALPQHNPALEALQTYKQRDLSKGTRGRPQLEGWQN